MAKLGEYAEFIMGQAPSGKDCNTEGNGTPFVKAGQFTAEGTPIIDEWTTNPLKMATDNDVLICVVGATSGKLNRGIECAIGRSVAAIRANSDCLREYIYYGLQPWVQRIRNQAQGSAIGVITKDMLYDMDMPFPEVNEQQKIVEIISKAENVIRTRKQEIEQLDLLIRARFVELFGVPDINPMGWDEKQLSDCLDVVGGYAFKSDSFAEEGIPVLRIGNINAGYFKPVNMVYWENDKKLDRYKMYPGDLVMSLTGTVGKDDYGNVCILGTEYAEYYLNQRNAKLDLWQGLNKYYLSYLLKFEQIKKKLTGISRGVRQANISNKDILNLCVPIPPIDLQEQFASFVTKVDKSKVEGRMIIIGHR